MSWPAAKKAAAAAEAEANKNKWTVAIAVVDRDAMKGYRFEGTPEAITAGPAFDQTAELLEQRARDPRPPGRDQDRVVDKGGRRNP